MKDDPGPAARLLPRLEARPGGELLLIVPVPPPAAPQPQGPGLQPSPYPKAELLPRLLARLFDLMVCGALIALMHRAGAAAACIYLLLGDALFRGQSFGKRMLGIRVVHVPTRKGAGSRQSAIRNFPMAVLGLLAMGPVEHWRLIAASSLAVLGYEAVRVLLHPLGLRLGDELARTQVVDAKVVAGAPTLAAPTRARPATGGYDRLDRRAAPSPAAPLPAREARAGGRAARPLAPPGWFGDGRAFGP